MRRWSVLQAGIRSRHHFPPPLRVLGIETSCDDTGAAIVEWSPSSPARVLSERLHSQVAVHVAHGGIVPPVACSLHERHLAPLVQSCLDASGLAWRDLSALAVTTRPGLALSLKVGLQHAKLLSQRHGLPLIPVHHMRAHALTPRLLSPDAASPPFPFLVLLVSGGHALMAVARDVDRFSLLGTRLDISPGDCFDKVARRAGLARLAACAEVSGGQAVEMMARDGDHTAFVFRNVRMHHRDCNLSFSGLQSAAIRMIDRLEAEKGVDEDGLVLQVRDVCASLQHAVAVNIARRLQRAVVFAESHGLLPFDTPGKAVVVSGGVAANAHIRRVVERVADYYGYALVCPPARLCRDNGVMIAWAGLELARRGIGVETDVDGLDFEPRCVIGEDLCEEVRRQNIRPARIKLTPPPATAE